MSKKSFIFSLFAILIFIIVNLFVPSAYADRGCCRLDSAGKANVKCEVIGAGQQCASGQRLCDTGNNVSVAASKVDFNGDGAMDDYNSECFIAISPPEQVRITDFGRLFTGAVAVLLLVAFILAFFFLILGGISWLTSGGDKSAVEAARNKIIAALIGLVIVAATWALFQLVGGAIGYNILGGFTIPTLF